jgi:hypothetical protein
MPQQEVTGPFDCHGTTNDDLEEAKTGHHSSGGEAQHTTLGMQIYDVTFDPMVMGLQTRSTISIELPQCLGPQDGQLSLLYVLPKLMDLVHQNPRHENYRHTLLRLSRWTYMNCKIMDEGTCKEETKVVLKRYAQVYRDSRNM